MQDAMGEVLGDNLQPIEVALHINKTLGIPISATFNNIMVRPSQQNLDTFITNFRPLYEAGVRSATIPHTHWMATGQIKKNFPELFVKNTILRNVVHPNEIVNLAKAGFDYVNIDRDLMRDRDMLTKMRKAANIHGTKLALLANEGCLGGCPMMDEHYEYNLTRIQSPAYFNDPISRVSCMKWDREDPAVALKTANIPPWRADWVELLEFVDVFKMHGRESIGRMYETMDIVDRYVKGEELLFPAFKEYIEDTKLPDKPINGWRNKIKNCKFDCWDCNYCDKIYEVYSDAKSHPLVLAVTKELVDSVNSDYQPSVKGLTSVKVQKLLNSLAKHCSKYLEIGAGIGSTCSAVGEGNSIELNVVDSWKTDVQPARDDIEVEENLMENFQKNTANLDVNIFVSDMLKVDAGKIKNIDLFMYDAAHDPQSIIDAMKHYQNCFSDVCVYIFDDANWAGVYHGAREGFRNCGIEVIYEKLMLNETENPDQYWNGLYIAVGKKTDKKFSKFLI